MFANLPIFVFSAPVAVQAILDSPEKASVFSKVPLAYY